MWGVAWAYSAQKEAQGRWLACLDISVGTIIGNVHIFSNHIMEF